MNIARWVEHETAIPRQVDDVGLRVTTRPAEFKLFWEWTRTHPVDSWLVLLPDQAELNARVRRAPKCVVAEARIGHVDRSWRQRGSAGPEPGI